jgi:hypothetical protein
MSFSSSEKVLGLGNEGIVITKPFECENPSVTTYSKNKTRKSIVSSNRSSRKSFSFTKKETIIKLSVGEGAVREYTFMKQLPQGRKYPYAQIKHIDLCKVKMGPTTMNHLKRLSKIKKEINEEWLGKFMENQDNIWQIFMPRLGNRSLYSILRKKQMPVNRQIFYDINSRIDGKFMTVKQLKNILHHFSKLLFLFIELNGKSLYHNDLKSNNIMCDVDKKGNISKMWLIDFDTSIDWNQQNATTHGKWEYDYKFRDVCDLMVLLVREVLLVACSNKPMYDELSHFFTEIDDFIYETKQKIMDSKWENINSDATKLLGKIKSKVDTLEEPSWNEYVNVVVPGRKIPIKTQRENARNHNENNTMGIEDTRYR